MKIEKDSYEIGYTLRGNCTSPPSYPAVNLTWYINKKKVSTRLFQKFMFTNNPTVIICALILKQCYCLQYFNFSSSIKPLYVNYHEVTPARQAQH